MVTIHPRKQIGHVVGQTETLITNPGSSAALVLDCEAVDARLKIGDHVGKTFTAANATNLFTATAHGFKTGDGPYPVSNSGGALPAGLAAATPYWIIRVDDNTFRLASSLNNAMAAEPVAVDITTDGTGTQTIGGITATAPGSSVSNGLGSIELDSAAGDRRVVRIAPAPAKVTVKGSAAGSIVTYWWE